MEGRREAVKAKILAENKVHVSKVHVCPPLSTLFDNFRAALIFWPFLGARDFQGANSKTDL